MEEDSTLENIAKKLKWSKLKTQRLFNNMINGNSNKKKMVIRWTENIELIKQISKIAETKKRKF